MATLPQVSVPYSDRPIVRARRDELSLARKTRRSDVLRVVLRSVRIRVAWSYLPYVDPTIRGAGGKTLFIWRESS